MMFDLAGAEHERFGDHYMIFYAPYEGDTFDNCVVMNFVVLEIVGDEVEPEPSVLYHRAGWTSSGDDVKDPTQAAQFWAGSIKWDGCSNWDFNTEDCMAHFCGVEHAASIGGLMRRMYEITAEKMKRFDRACAEMENRA